MAKKCRGFDEDDGYDLLGTMKSKEEVEPNVNSSESKNDN